MSKNEKKFNFRFYSRLINGRLTFYFFLYAARKLTMLLVTVNIR